MKPVFLVLGAGAGIGGTTARRFAREGYHSVLCRRSDQAGLDRMIDEIHSEGGSASGYLIDASKPDSIEDIVEKIETEVGPIQSDYQPAPL